MSFLFVPITVLTVLGAKPPARTGDLATRNAAQIGGTTVMAKGSVVPGDGGGGLFKWEAGQNDGDNGGTIIVPRSGGGRWRRVFSGAMEAPWFGTGGDPCVPDTTAIRNAIQAASGGGALHFPKGTYLVNGSADMVPLQSGVTITGDGRDSVIKVACGNGDYNSMFSSQVPVHDVTFKDLTFDQNGAHNIWHNACEKGKECGPGRYVVALKGANHITFDHAFFDYSGSNALNIDGSDVTITHSRFSFVYAGDTFYDVSGIYIHAKGQTISDNVFSAPAQLDAVKAPGCGIEIHLGPANVTNNKVENYFTGVNLVSGDAVYGDNDDATQPNSMLVSNNTLTGVDIGMKLWALQHTALEGYFLRDVNITKNSIQLAHEAWGATRTTADSNSSSGIVLYSFLVPDASSPVFGFPPGGFAGLRIFGNDIAYVPTTSSAPATVPLYSAGIALRAQGVVRNVEVRNNTINSSPGRGIDLSFLDELGQSPAPIPSPASHVTIAANVIKNSGMHQPAPNPSHRAAVVSDGRVLHDCTLENNQITYSLFLPPGLATGSTSSRPLDRVR